MQKLRGFTLIEVVIAFAIAGITLALLAQITGAASRNVALAGTYERAISLAQTLLDEAAAAGDEAASVANDEFSWDIVVTPYTPDDHALDTDASDTQTGANSERLIATSVTVTWKTTKEPGAVTLRRLSFGAPP